MSKQIFLLAGEASGDQLGGPLMAQLKAAHPDISFAGVGGEAMQAQGLESLMPMEELCVMGLAEVLDHLPRLLKLIQGMVEEIEQRQPDVLVTIDLPDFNFRVAQKLKKRGVFKGKIIHYVAPTVWAWRAGRAKKIAGFLDGLMCLFPFEPPYFEKYGLKTTFVGHPLVEKPLEGADYRAERGIPADKPVLAVLFGSRRNEFAALGPVFEDALDLVKEQVPDLELVVPTLPHMEYEVTELLSRLDIPSAILLEDDKKRAAMQGANAALAVSGTVALELAYAGTPHIIAYKTNFFTYLLLKLLVKSKYAHLANIILDKPAVPEYLQFACTSEKLAAGLLKLLKDPQAVAAQKQDLAQITEALSVKGRMPSAKAAQFITHFLK